MKYLGIMVMIAIMMLFATAGIGFLMDKPNWYWFLIAGVVLMMSFRYRETTDDKVEPPVEPPLEP